MIFRYIEEKTENLLKENDFFIPGFDVIKLAKKIGVQVLKKKFDDDVSGVFIMSDKTPIISYNGNEDNKRIRFTVAHELGHYILHSNEQPFFLDKSPKAMYRNSASTTGEFLKEREANAFAASLLMPSKLIEIELEGLSDEVSDIVKYLAKKFNVSEQAMTFRLSNLDYYIA
jgi:Zn-dependent peptidase ImmA (M78 family)